MAEVSMADSLKNTDDDILVKSDLLIKNIFSNKVTLQKIDKHLHISSGNINSKIPITVDETYPDCAKLYPDGDPTVTVKFDSAQLKKLCTLVEDGIIVLSVYDSSKPVMFESVLKDENKVRGLIATIKMDE